MTNTALNRTGVVIKTNKSGGAHAQGDVCVEDTSNANAVINNTAGAYKDGPIWVCIEPNGVANNAPGAYAGYGYIPKVNLSGSASLGDLFKTHTVAGQAVRHAGPFVAGDFGMVLGTGSTPAAWLFGLPNQGSPTNADIAGTFALSGDISPSQITSNQNDYNPTGLSTASVLRLNTDASRNITGLQGGADGRIVTIVNVGSNAIVLKDDDGSTSTAANRFALSADITLAADDGVILLYDSTSSRWRCIGKSPGGGAGGAMATDTIWDAKGDIVGGTGPDAASKLSVGTDGFQLAPKSSASNGLEWKAPSHLPIAAVSGPSIAIPTSGWTARNSPLVHDFFTDSITLHIPDSGSMNWRFITRSLGGLSTYTLIAAIEMVTSRTIDSMTAGVCLFDGTKYELIEILSQSSGRPAKLRIEKLNSATSDNSTAAGPTDGLVGRNAAFKIVEDGVHRTWYYWIAGAWVQLLQETTNTFLTPTDVGFGGISVASNTSDFTQVKLLYWSLA